MAPSAKVLLCLLAVFPGVVSRVGEAAPQRYALVVGVKEYPVSEKLSKLPYAEEDATELAAVLEKIGYDVTLMTQKSAEGEDRRRFAPTAAFLLKEFETLVKTPFLQKTDCVLVTLAGHGIQLPSKNDPKKTSYYFCPADARIDDLEFLEDVQPGHNLISVDEFYATLNQCKAGVRLLVVDACRNDPNQPGAFRSAKSITRPTVSVPPGGLAALFSCSANERAVEDGDLKHGVFTHYLIEALNGQADTDKDRELTISEIQAYVGRRTFDYVRKKYGRQQLPELTGSIQGWAALASLPTEAAPKPPVKPRPPADAVAFQGHHYKVYYEILSWHEAKAKCESLGGHLAIVTSLAENNFVNQLAIKNLKNPIRFDGAWLGATDEKQEGKWVWVDGTEMVYKNWQGTQPNNKMQAEHYLLLWFEPGQWADQPVRSMQHRAFFVCEWE